MQATRFESETRSLRVSRQFLIVLVLLFVSLMIWTFISIGASQNETTISPELIALSRPLNPSVDRSVLEELAEKNYTAPNEISPFIIYKLVTSSDGKSQTVVPIGTTSSSTIITPSSRASSSASPTPSPTIVPLPSPSPSTIVEPTPPTESITGNASDSEGI